MIQCTAPTHASFQGHTWWQLRVGGLGLHFGRQGLTIAHPKLYLHHCHSMWNGFNKLFWEALSHASYEWCICGFQVAWYKDFIVGVDLQQKLGCHGTTTVNRHLWEMPVTVVWATENCDRTVFSHNVLNSSRLKDASNHNKPNPEPM